MITRVWTRVNYVSNQGDRILLKRKRSILNVAQVPFSRLFILNSSKWVSSEENIPSDKDDSQDPCKTVVY